MQLFLNDHVSTLLRYYTYVYNQLYDYSMCKSSGGLLMAEGGLISAPALPHHLYSRTRDNYIWQM